MSKEPILLVGGSGAVGRWTARLLREAHPDQPLLIGGRDRQKAEHAVASLRAAEAVSIDLTAEDLGLGDRAVSAVVVFFTDQRLATLRFAQARGVPHVSISPGLFELGPEVAAYTHSPRSSAVVLGTEWLVGATTVPTLAFAKAFDRVDHISIGALLDEQDVTGPAGNADMERQNAVMPAALIRRNGALQWLTGDDLKTRFHAADGSAVEASFFSVNDVLALITATNVPNFDFQLAVGTSSTRRRGEPFSSEIIVEISGRDRAGEALRTRHAVVHPKGQMPLTGLGVALLLERLLGLDGKPAVPPGLYLPYQLLDPDRYFSRFHQIGGQILALRAQGLT